MCSSCNCGKDIEELMDEPLVSLNDNCENDHEDFYDYNNNEGEEE